MNCKVFHLKELVRSLLVCLFVVVVVVVIVVLLLCLCKLSLSLMSFLLVTHQHMRALGLNIVSCWTWRCLLVFLFANPFAAAAAGSLQQLYCQQQQQQLEQEWKWMMVLSHSIILLLHSFHTDIRVQQESDVPELFQGGLWLSVLCLLHQSSSVGDPKLLLLSPLPVVWDVKQLQQMLLFCQRKKH